MSHYLRLIFLRHRVTDCYRSVDDMAKLFGVLKAVFGALALVGAILLIVGGILYWRYGIRQADNVAKVGTRYIASCEREIARSIKRSIVECA